MKQVALTLALLSTLAIPTSSWADGMGAGGTAGGSQGAVRRPPPWEKNSTPMPVPTMQKHQQAGQM
ncbi:hypothetical protein [Silvimonas sp.]|uniref:hypothetical protein n=1 Tax=Silvimonas sp. TaxID=2650811 RepID=UPI00284489FA|nr:hypothetical protein [Silvimonas sp.]MDR3429490.1 hypothetical protein [Silvimonas sp.]